MKKIIIAAAALLTFAFSSVAQPVMQEFEPGSGFAIYPSSGCRNSGSLFAEYRAFFNDMVDLGVRASTSWTRRFLTTSTTDPDSGLVTTSENKYRLWGTKIQAFGDYHLPLAANFTPYAGVGLGPQLCMTRPADPAFKLRLAVTPRLGIRLFETIDLGVEFNWVPGAVSFNYIALNFGWVFQVGAYGRGGGYLF